MKKKEHKEARMLTVIPEPEANTRAVLVPAPGVCPIIKGQGTLDLLCGNCQTVLIEGIFEGQVQNIVVRCPKCNAYNEVLFAVERIKPKFPRGAS